MFDEFTHFNDTETILFLIKHKDSCQNVPEKHIA